ncbi:DnaJ-domain-containing protein [Violaceomyces palustris]|uniref:DnaJ-domain-containing protein n=1 Tax=Violaceomyces palustris TaxID=1673888 RepID=A0ACD0NQ33_9BASI|nr:DnaJ-domain-containing protein [Violaceomyces palustris]
MAADAESSDTNQEDLASNHVKHSSTCRRRHRQPISASAPPPQDLSFPSHLTNPSPYEIFHLSRDCTSRQVKSRYYDLVKLLHPDKAFAASNASKVDTKAQENFKKVVQAYELLRDPKRRSLYDRTGFGWTTAGGGTQVTAYDEWCGALRRGGSPGGTRSPAWEDPRYKRYGKGHDGYGWQSATGRPDDFSFYGFYAPKDKAHMPRYTSNKVFFTSIMIVTWVVAAFQYQRLSAQSARAVARADKNHLEAAKSLDEARDLARSEEGRRRLEAFKRRARETRVLEAIEKMEAEALARQTQNGTILPSHLIEPVRASHDHRNVG